MKWKYEFISFPTAMSHIVLGTYGHDEPVWIRTPSSRNWGIRERDALEERWAMGDEVAWRCITYLMLHTSSVTVSLSSMTPCNWLGGGGEGWAHTLSWLTLPIFICYKITACIHPIMRYSQPNLPYSPQSPQSLTILLWRSTSKPGRPITSRRGEKNKTSTMQSQVRIGRKRVTEMEREGN